MNTVYKWRWWLFFSLTFFWGTSFLQISISLQSFTPAQIVFGRLLLATMVLLIYMLITKQSFTYKIKDWGLFTLFAIIGSLLPYWLISTGQTTVTSGLAGLLMAVMPLVTCILAHWFIPEEPLNTNRMIGFVLGISGVMFILWPSLISGSNSFWGALLIFIAAIAYAINTTIIRLYGNYNAVMMSTGVLIVATCLAFIMWWPDIMAIEIQTASWTSILSLIWLGIGPTGVATVILFVLVKSAGSTFVSNNNYLIPIIAYTAGATLLGETILLTDLMALCIILLGIMISRLKSSILILKD